MEYNNIEKNANNANNEVCNELKSIQYKTLLEHGESIEEKIKIDKDIKLDNILNTTLTVSNEPWCKLNKTNKINKLLIYVEKYKINNKLSDEETEKLTVFIKDAIDKKKLQKIKDVVYDKATGVIKDIPSLVYIKNKKHFTLKKLDKRVSTLKSLGPKKNNKNNT